MPKQWFWTSDEWFLAMSKVMFGRASRHCSKGQQWIPAVSSCSEAELKHWFKPSSHLLLAPNSESESRYSLSTQSGLFQWSGLSTNHFWNISCLELSVFWPGELFCFFQRLLSGSLGASKCARIFCFVFSDQNWDWLHNQMAKKILHNDLSTKFHSWTIKKT